MPKISRTEALILAEALEQAKFSFTHHAAGRSKKASVQLINKLNYLQKKLEVMGDDGRMHGRRHIWDFYDRLRWWCFGNYREHLIPEDPKAEPKPIDLPDLFSND